MKENVHVLKIHSEVLLDEEAECLQPYLQMGQIDGDIQTEPDSEIKERRQGEEEKGRERESQETNRR